MSIESSVITALSAVAGGRVYPQAAPEKAAKPFVIYKARTKPVTAISGAVLAWQTEIVFECWAGTYQGALDVATSVASALSASSLRGVPIEAAEDGYDPAVDEFVRPLAYEFVASP